MNNNYTIILFKNKERYKIIKNYKTYKNALPFFNSKVKESNEVVFDVQTENGRDVNYEIALIEKTSEKLFPIYRTDEMGRNIPVQLNDPNYAILKIEKYNIPEKVFHISKKQKISSEKLINTYLKGDSLKLVSKLNNKIIIQDENIYNLFSLKSIYDADRFLINLEKYMISNNKSNCLIVKDSSREQKKYLYEILENYGFSKQYLYRSSTTHPK
jgi:hypothetical protein